MKNKSFQIFKIVLSILIIAALFYFLKEDFSALTLDITYTRVVGVTVALFVSILVRAIRWLQVTNYYLSSNFSLGFSIRYLFIGSALNIVLPAGAGDVLKGYIAQKETNNKGAFVFASLYDKLVAIASLFFLAIYAFYSTQQIVFLFAGLLSLVPLLVIHLASHDRFNNSIIGFTEKYKALERFRKFIYPPKPASLKLIVFSLFLSVLGWVCTYILLYLCFDIVSAHIPLPEVMKQSSIITLARLFPFTLNGIGTDEGLMIYLFKGNNALILAGALLYRLILIIIPAVIGLILFNIQRKDGKTSRTT